MTVAYFDCFAGAGGDMIVATLLDAGCDLVALRSGLSKLDVGGYTLTSETVTRGGISGTKFNVQIPEDNGHGPHRGLKDCLDLLLAELKKVMQRVNLFEKIKIPETQDNIRRIRIAVGDQMTAGVARAKIAKAKLVLKELMNRSREAAAV